MAAAKKKAGEVKETAPVQTAQPINEAKVLKLIQMMFPGAQKAATLQDGVTLLLAEYDRQKRAIADLEKNVAGPSIVGGDPSLHKKMDDLLVSFKQVKENLSFVLQRSASK